MPAITVSYTTIAGTAVDPDSPIDTGLMTALRDNAEFVKQWLGASFVAGAVQDHNHDGVNSAKLQIGSNSVRNGSFEDAATATGWTTNAFSGGTIAINAVNHIDGKQALAITSTVLANGGGQADSNEFDPITGDALYNFKVAVKASVTGVSSKAEYVWYDSAQAQISVSIIYSDTSTPTVAKQRGQLLRAPAAARFGKVRLTGGIPATGSATGTVYFDGVSKSEGPGLVEPGTANLLAASDNELTTNSLSAVKLKEIYCAYDGVLRLEWDAKSDGGGDTGVQARVNGSAATRSTGAATVEQTTTGTSYATYSEEVFVRAGDLLQLYVRHGTGAPQLAYVKNFRIKTGSIAPQFIVLS